MATPHSGGYTTGKVDNRAYRQKQQKKNAWADIIGGFAQGFAKQQVSYAEKQQEMRQKQQDLQQEIQAKKDIYGYQKKIDESYAEADSARKAFGQAVNSGALEYKEKNIPEGFQRGAKKVPSALDVAKTDQIRAKLTPRGKVMEEIQEFSESMMAFPYAQSFKDGTYSSMGEAMAAGVQAQREAVDLLYTEVTKDKPIEAPDAQREFITKFWKDNGGDKLGTDEEKSALLEEASKQLQKKMAESIR